MAQHISVKKFFELKSRKELVDSIQREFSDDVEACIAIECAWLAVKKGGAKVAFCEAENIVSKFQDMNDGNKVMYLPRDYNISSKVNEYSFILRPSEKIIKSVSRKYGMELKDFLYILEFHVHIPFTRSRCKILDVFIVA